MDVEHLRFSGSKNMDYLLTQFYDNHFKTLRNNDTSLFSILKSYVKLSDHIEKQRKILSANHEHSLNV
jgi:hypothetical protein